LYCRRKVKQTLLSHSIHYLYAPPHILNLDLPPAASNPYPLRHQRLYHLPTSRTDRHTNSPILKALSYFNSLPQDLRSIPSRNAFKEALHSLLLNSICCCSHHPHAYT
jgi:hypothetical protein